MKRKLSTTIVAFTHKKLKPKHRAEDLSDNLTHTVQAFNQVFRKPQWKTLLKNALTAADYKCSSGWVTQKVFTCQLDPNNRVGGEA